MSIRATYRVQCDEPGCHCSATPGQSEKDARHWASREGFDLGPREVRPHINQYTDYCPEHRKAATS